jgi:hypothetical protein
MLQSRERSDVPITTDALQQAVSLFDCLVGTGDHRRSHGQADFRQGMSIDTRSL